MAHLRVEREEQVMAEVVEGRPNKLIADDLGLSTRTVETHRAHIMEKMGALSLSHLVRMAVVLMPLHGGRAQARCVDSPTRSAVMIGNP